MNKCVALMAGGGALLALAGSASATVFDPTLNQVFSLAPIIIPVSTGQSLGPTQTLIVPANPSPVVGFTISFSYAETPGDASWASDLQLRISGPGIPGTITIGSTAAPYTPWGAPTPGFVWSFDGSGSSLPGVYSSTFWFKSTPWTKPGGTWQILTADSFNGGTSYTNIQLTLHKIPAPGAVALLGLAGLAGSRRRR